jgi:hypothetical protein
MMSIYKIWINVFKTLKTLLYINPNLVLKFHGNQLVKANLSYIPFVFWGFPICCSRVLGLFSWKIWHFFKCHTITQFCFNQFPWNVNTTLGLTEESSLLILSFQSYGNLFMENLTFFSNFVQLLNFTKCWRTDGFHEWSTITLEWQKWKSWKLKGILLWSILALWWNFRKKY